MRLTVVVGLVLAIAAPARAQGGDELGIAWQAPAACPDAAAVRARIAQRIATEPDLPVTIEVAQLGARYVAEVDLGGDIRTLASARCDDLADAVAVIVARAASEHHAAPRRLAMREPEQPEVTVHSVLEAPRPRAWTIGARLSGVSGIGVIPEVGLGAELAITLRRHSTLAELAATRWALSEAQLHAGAPAKVDVGLDVTAMRIGWRSENRPLRGWMSVEAGTMYGSGVSLANAQVGEGRWVAAGAGFGVAWPMTRWLRLVGTTEVMLALDRVRFALSDGQVVYAPAPMSARATCGIEVGWQ
jgi:hypothetical protein